MEYELCGVWIMWSMNWEYHVPAQPLQLSARSPSLINSESCPGHISILQWFINKTVDINTRLVCLHRIIIIILGFINWKQYFFPFNLLPSNFLSPFAKLLPRCQTPPPSKLLPFPAPASLGMRMSEIFRPLTPPPTTILWSTSLALPRKPWIQLAPPPSSSTWLPNSIPWDLSWNTCRHMSSLGSKLAVWLWAWLLGFDISMTTVTTVAGVRWTSIQWLIGKWTTRDSL